MYLKKLEMIGFKSFADKVEMEFRPGVTGIVGPNGSGKSNIADAVRWVLGEQNARMLRGGKMEDVIFGGTAKRKALAYCEVTMTFDNEDGALDSPFTEIAVTRRLYRTGESEYQMNHAPCRMKDIVTLFRDTGVGKEGYSIIGQGRIDAILGSRCEDRRAVFEDAAGIAKFTARKQEAQRKLDNTAQNLVRIEDILEELNAQAEPLREQSEAAREYLRLRDGLKELEVNVFLYQIDRSTQRIEEMDATVAALDSRQASGREEAARMDEQSVRLQADIEQTEREVSDLQRQHLDAMRVNQQAESEHRLRMQAVEHEQAEQNRISSEKQEQSARLEELKRERDAHRETLEGQSANRLRYQEEEQQASRQYEQLTRRAEAEEEQIEARKAAMIASLNRLSDIKTRQARAQAMQDALRGRAAEVEVQLQEAAAEAVRIEEELAAALADSEQVRGKFNELTGRMKEREGRKAALQAQLEKSREVLRTQREAAAATEERVKMLTSMKSEYEGYQNSVRRLLNDVKRDARLQAGVHGAVAELISVPEAYTVAMEVAMGPALQNVVTDTEEVARKLIDHLRLRQYGRATFLPLSAVRGRTLDGRERSVLRTKGVVGVASELISYDKRYAPVVESLLGRTVIVEDMDAAIAVMRACGHSFRTVTLKGDMMNPGGSMTGGSLQNKGAGILSRERELEAARQRLAKCREALAQALAQRQQAETLLAQGDAEADALLQESHQQEIAMAREEERCRRIRTAQSDARALAEQLELEKSQLADNLGDVQEELDTVLRLQQQMEQTEQQSETDSVQAQNAYQQLKRQQAEMLDEVNRLRMLLMGLSQEKDGLERDIRRLDGEEVRLTERMGQLDAQTAQSKERVALLMEQDAEYKNDQASGALLDKLRLACADKERVLAEQREARKRHEEARRSAEESLRGIDDERNRLNVTKARLESEMAAIHDRLWNEYELTYANAQPLRAADFRPSADTQQVNRLRREMRALGDVNVSSIDMYTQLVERRDSLNLQRDDLIKAREDLETIITGLQKVMEQQFTQQFALINENFGQTFTELFGGGRAELKLMDPDQPLVSDIEIIAQPPGKKLQRISLLSGGERALTAIAILFAILRLRPTPFCLLDEIEAPLDEENSVLFARFLREYAQRSQFVMITHRKQTMEQCDVLYGVAMEEKGVSKLVSVRMVDMITPA